MKYKALLLWLFVFALLVVFLQAYSEYHFYYIEQNQLFQNDWIYVADHLKAPGGFALVLAESLVQFYLFPYMGAVILAALLTIIGITLSSTIKKIALAVSNWFLLPLLPVLSLLFIQFDFNYYLHGTVAFLLLLLALRLYFQFKTRVDHICCSIMMVLLLYWLAGPVALLFALIITLWEGLKVKEKNYWVAIPFVLAILCAIAGLRLGYLGHYRYAFLPDFYYQPLLRPRFFIYFSWISLLLVFLIAFVFRNRKEIKPKRIIVESIIQVVVIAGLFYLGVKEFDNPREREYEELDYLVRTEQWDALIDKSRGKLTNYLHITMLNIALTEKGELAGRMFSFDQRGPMESYRTGTGIPPSLFCKVISLSRRETSLMRRRWHSKPSSRHPGTAIRGC